MTRLLSIVPLGLIAPHLIEPAAAAQAISASGRPRVQISVRYSATRANSPPGSCGCFLLHGAALDAALPLYHSWAAAVEVGGNHADRVPASDRQLSTITLLAGPRYTHSFGLRQRLFVQALFGAVRGFDADFRRGNDPIDTATGFTFAVGGAYEFRLTQAVALRPVQVDLVQTNLPNGANGGQRNLRFGAGFTFAVPLGRSHR